MATPKKAVEEKKSLAVIDNAVFDLQAISEGSADIQDNLDQVQIVLSQIKIIHAGQIFEMADGTKAETFEGIILDFNRVNSYWPPPPAGKPDITGDPPTCFSTDAVRPSPFSAELQSDFCASCPQNKPGSDPKGGRGRACKNKMRVHLVLDKGQLLPYRLMLSGANLMPFSKFISSMVTKGYPWRMCWCRFGLKPATGSGGQVYSEIEIKAVSSIAPDQVAISKRISENLMPILRDTASMAQDDD
jgi:hypothetical protein